MRSLITKAGVLAATSLVLVTGTARASTIEVKVPFPFVIHGQTLPAGQYRVDDEGGVIQLRGEKGNHASMIVFGMPATRNDPKQHEPGLSFKRFENQYRLTNVWESAAEGREINPS